MVTKEDIKTYKMGVRGYLSRIKTDIEKLMEDIEAILTWGSMDIEYIIKKIFGDDE